MLTRFKVDGFKNLQAVDLYFGPFTCIAGANGVGKSNLFDAIRFLSALADQPLMDAALSVRGDNGRSTDIRSIFHRVGDTYQEKMSFLAEMLVPAEGVDDLGQVATSSMTFLSYELELELRTNGLAILREELRHINKGDALRHLPFPHRPIWRNSVVTGRRTSPFISTDDSQGSTHIKLHQDGGKEYLGGGRPRPHVAERLPRTVLSSTTNAAESPTAVLARREMQSWRLLQLEPSALRAPDSYNSPNTMDVNGAHLPATLARLARVRGARLTERQTDSEASHENQASALYADLANRLSELIDDVHSIRVESDESRELLKLMLEDRDGTEHEARSLSDGTLRFLALAILERDPTAQGVLCLEEPENGIHPERIPAILDLLRDLVADPSELSDDTNPLRQVIINTHSPAVVGQVDDDDLLLVVPEETMFRGRPCLKPVFRWLRETWRARHRPNLPAVAPGRVVSYLNPVPALDRGTFGQGKPKRVVDRPDIQQWLPFAKGRNAA